MASSRRCEPLQIEGSTSVKNGVCTAGEAATLGRLANCAICVEAMRNCVEVAPPISLKVDTAIEATDSLIQWLTDLIVRGHPIPDNHSAACQVIGQIFLAGTIEELAPTIGQSSLNREAADWVDDFRQVCMTDRWRVDATVSLGHSLMSDDSLLLTAVGGDRAKRFWESIGPLRELKKYDERLAFKVGHVFHWALLVVATRTQDNCSQKTRLWVEEKLRLMLENPLNLCRYHLAAR